MCMYVYIHNARFFCSVFTKGTTLTDLDQLCSMLLLSHIHQKREFSAEIHENIAAVFLQFVNAENLPANQLLVKPHTTYKRTYIYTYIHTYIHTYALMF